MKSIRLIVLAAFVALLVVACGPLTDAIPVTVSSELAGENEVPPVATAAAGQVTATLTGTTLVVEGSFTGLMSDLREIQEAAAHVHRAPAGENGPIVQGLTVEPGDGRAGTITGTLELGAELVAAFLAGELYVNIHTDGNPAGELRAQLATGTPTFAPATQLFDARLLPENEVHGEVASDATGAATALLRDDGTLTTSGSFADLGSPLYDVGALGPAHVHAGAAGEEGAVVFPLAVAAGADGLSGRFGTTVDATPAQVATLRAGGFYVNVHSEGYPAGELRGQLFPSHATSTATLSGDEEAPPVASDATGTATATMEGFTLSVDGSFEGLVADFTAAHVHVGAPGVAGPVVFPLAVDTATDLRSGTFTLETELSEVQRADFVGGNHYVNVHSVDHSGGEIRGQFDTFEYAPVTPEGLGLP
jgi:hypothetical protein